MGNSQLRSQQEMELNTFSDKKNSITSIGTNKITEQ